MTKGTKGGAEALPKQHNPDGPNNRLSGELKKGEPALAIRYLPYLGSGSYGLGGTNSLFSLALPLPLNGIFGEMEYHIWAVSTNLVAN